MERTRAVGGGGVPVPTQLPGAGRLCIPDQRDRGQEPTSQDAWGHHVRRAPFLSVVLEDCRVEVAGLGGRAGTGERKKCALHGEIGFCRRAAGEIQDAQFNPNFR